MRFLLKVTIMAAGLATAAWGTACTSGTYASYEALSSGCTVGDELFSNFSSLSFSGTLGLTISTSDIVITPEVSGDVDELVFTYQDLPAGNYSSTVAGVTADQILGYDFTYLVTPDSNPVTGMQMISDIGNTGSGSVSAVKDILIASTLYESSANNGTTDYTLPTLVSGPTTALPGSSAFTVQDTISLQGQTGTAQQQDYTNLFTEGAISEVPEPSAALLIGTGLICVGLTRKLRADRARRG